MNEFMERLPPQQEGLTLPIRKKLAGALPPALFGHFVMANLVLIGPQAAGKGISPIAAFSPAARKAGSRVPAAGPWAGGQDLRLSSFEVYSPAHR